MGQTGERVRGLGYLFFVSVFVCILYCRESLYGKKTEKGDIGIKTVEGKVYSHDLNFLFNNVSSTYTFSENISGYTDFKCRIDVFKE